MDTPSFATSSCLPRFDNNMNCSSHNGVNEKHYPNKDDSIHMQTYNIVKELSDLKKGYDLRFALILMTIAFLIMLGAFLGAIVFSLYVLQNHSIDSKDALPLSGTPSRLTQHYQYVGLSDLNTLPLTQLEDMQSLVLQWGQAGSGKDKQYYYNIQSAFRDGNTNTTTLHLSNDHSLVANSESAVLLDNDSNELGVLEFVSGHMLPTDDGNDNNSSSSSRVTNMNSLLSSSSSYDSSRRLGKLGDYLNGKLEDLFTKSKLRTNRPPGGPPSDMFDAYCRYGCGGMAVTFPYYYRPHFGYGYPLVGTQSQFPEGYGGYAGAPIMREAHEQYVGSNVGVP